MRKLEFTKDAEKNRRRNQLILGGFLIFTMLFSTIGYAFETVDDSATINGTNTEKIKFNDFYFTQQSGFWIMDYNGNNLIFRYNPSELLDIDFSFKPLADYSSKPLYIYSESINAKSEVRSNLFSFVNNIKDACLQDMKNCEGEIKTCQDNFIIIRENKERSIRQEENCVFIEGKKDDLTRMTDEFIYKLLGAA